MLRNAPDYQYMTTCKVSDMAFKKATQTNIHWQSGGWTDDLTAILQGRIRKYKIIAQQDAYVVDSRGPSNKIKNKDITTINSEKAKKPSGPQNWLFNH